MFVLVCINVVILVSMWYVVDQSGAWW